MNEQNKYQGKKGEFLPIREDASRVIVSYGYKEIDSDNATWLEVDFYKKQNSQLTLQMVKDAIIGDINKRTDERILNGFKYEDKPVWLSEENQRNFSEAQRVAQMLPERILPVTFKLGEDAEGKPVYHEFGTSEELTGFYLQTVAFIQQQLSEGWQEKDAVDFTPYEKYFADESEPVNGNAL